MFKLLVLFLFASHVLCLTDKQIKATGKMMRNVCQPKTKVTDVQIENQHKGIWEEDPNAKCYIHCVMLMSKFGTKEGRIDLEQVKLQLPTLPQDKQAPLNKTIYNCLEKVVPNDDKCDTAWQYARCNYFDNSDVYIFP